MEYGCIGKKLPHSFSKIIHEKIGSYSYELTELTEQELTPFMEKHEFKAINVTIPYKQAVIPFLYEISPTAKAIGAVNTVVNRDGRLYGYNTDFYGMTSLLNKNNIVLKNKKVAILGSGGTSKTSAAVAESLGAVEILRVSRSGKENSVVYSELYEKHSDIDVIINTTPVGMYPDIFESPIELSHFKNLSGVADAVYNPLTTKLVQDARRLGVAAQSGLYMLTAQAIRAYEIFMDKKADDGLLDSIFSDVLSSKKNIVLTGMPGSGKSTIGKAVAEKTGREFIDTDEEIKKEIGMEISDYFESFGERAFRDKETEIIKKTSALSGVVIATGGGAVLREENVLALKMNGTLYYMDRPLEQLIPTSDRPLASTKEAIIKRYDERIGIYLSSADKKIKVNGICEDAVMQIEKEHFGK